ncbi:hypothetical protein [Methanothrix soehngenii]
MEKINEDKVKKTHCLLLLDKSEFDISASYKEDLSTFLGIRP